MNNIFFQQLQLGIKCTSDESNPLEVYLKKAVHVAWKMLTIQPPMVIAFPSPGEYNDDVHEKDYFSWNYELEGSKNYKLSLLKPALYYFHKNKKPQIKAEVGNLPQPLLTKTLI